jgi:hypothetical protein
MEGNLDIRLLYILAKFFFGLFISCQSSFLSLPPFCRYYYPASLPRRSSCSDVFGSYQGCRCFRKETFKKERWQMSDLRLCHSLYSGKSVC